MNAETVIREEWVMQPVEWEINGRREVGWWIVCPHCCGDVERMESNGYCRKCNILAPLVLPRRDEYGAWGAA